MNNYYSRWFLTLTKMSYMILYNSLQTVSMLSEKEALMSERKDCHS